MAKRTATSDLNHDNWDRDDEQEDPGTFKRVKESDLKNRVIRKAKRSLNSESSGSSPFAKFSGFAASSSPFSFSKKTDIESSELATSSNLFSFSQKTDTEKSSGPGKFVAESQKDAKTENGSSIEIQERKSEGESKTTQKSVSNINTSIREKSSRNIAYYHQLQSLNESILKWMQLHLDKNACCDFTPVFNDYKKHMDTLNVTYPIKKREVVPVAEDKSNNGIFKAPTTSQDKDNKLTNSNVNSVVKTESIKKDDETDYGANFSARTTNTSTFSFGIKLTPTATSSGSPMGPNFSSKEEDKVPEKKTFQFSFGAKSPSEDSSAVKPFSFASAIAAKSVETACTEEKDYEPPKNEFVAVSEEDAIYSKRCKLFFKKGDGFADKGVGTLYLKSLEGKTQFLIRADTNLGNILLNIILSSSLPMSRTGKNNVLIVCVPNPPLDAKNPDSKEAIPMLIRVKTSEDADELLNILNKHKS